MNYSIEYWERWAAATGIRALKTMAETAVSLLGVGYLGVLNVDWVGVLSASMLAGVIAVLTCVGGLPEVKED